MGISIEEYLVLREDEILRADIRQRAILLADAIGRGVEIADLRTAAEGLRKQVQKLSVCPHGTLDFSECEEGCIPF